MEKKREKQLATNNDMLTRIMMAFFFMIEMMTER